MVSAVNSTATKAAATASGDKFPKNAKSLLSETVSMDTYVQYPPAGISLPQFGAENPPTFVDDSLRNGSSEEKPNSSESLVILLGSVTSCIRSAKVPFYFLFCLIQ